MSFDLVFNYLLKRTGPGCGAGPEGFKRLLARLGNPQNNYRIIHAAGTNGKGSVCHLCAQALRSAGHKTGLFVSPHLTSPCERIRVNGRLISKPAFAKACLAVFQEEEERLNFFEILTAAALVYFAQKKVAYAVLETGLGGRKDPTSACLPAVTAITSVGLDHCELLGSTLGQIAREKAGIIKPGVPVFCAPLAPGAIREIKKAAKAAGAPLHAVREGEPFTLKSVDWRKNRLLLQKGRAVWPLAVLGEKQTQNACLVYQMCRYLKLPESAVKKTFAAVKIPCRFEVVKKGKNIFIFDGAHNPAAAGAFADFFAQSPWAQNAALVCGFMKDKDYPKMLRLLAPRFSAVYVTAPAGPRAASLADVRAVMPKGTRAFYFASPARALRAASKAYENVAVTGSFYITGRLRARV